MRIDPTGPNIVMQASPSSPANRTQTVAAPSKSQPAAVDPALSGWQSPEHEVNVVLDQNQGIVYKFVDKDTGEAVEQIPPEETLRMIENIQHLLEPSERNIKVSG